MRTSRLAWLLLGCIAALLTLCLSACHSTRPVADARANAGITTHAATGVPVPDSVTITPRPTILDKLRGKAPVPRRVPAGAAVHTGKKATVNIYNAPATITTIGKKANAATGAGAKLAVAGKKAQQATDSAAVVATGGGAAAVGTGATATGGATTVKPDFWAILGAAALRLWWLWLLIAAFLFRKQLPVAGRFFA